MEPRLEIVNDQAVIDAWLKPEEGRDDAPRKDRVNHASKIGHPCDRYLVLRRTHGDKSAPPSERLKAIFKRGRVLEQPVAVQQLLRAGWRVWDEQRQFDIVEKGKIILSATIDCLGKPPDSTNTYVVDHKIVNPHDWDKIPRGWDGYDYLRESTKPWLRAWPAQIESYMYAHPGSAEVGLLQLIAADTLIPKFVYVPWDPEYMQSIIDRATMVNERAEAVLRSGMSELPPPIDWTENVCGRCELLGVCLPDQTGRTPLQLIEDEDFLELVSLDRDLAARKSALEKEYEDVHDRLKRAVGDHKEIVTGDWWITQKTITVRPKPNPDPKPYTYQKLDIKRLKVSQVDEEVA